MFEGQTISYFDAAGIRHPATITKVSGTGKSSFKILDLTYRVEGEAVELKGVAHENDNEGEGFWLEKGQHRKEPEPALEVERSTSKPTKGKK